MKLTAKVIGSYMSKTPPFLYFQLTPNTKNIETNLPQSNDQSTRYIFNLPADIERKFDDHFLRVYGTQTVMFTKFSHDVLTGYTNLVFSLNANKRFKFARFKIYGTYGIFKYLSAAKFHIQQKGLGLSFCSWLLSTAYHIGINDKQLEKNIINSDKFSQYIGRVNWKLSKQQQHKINDCRKHFKNCQTQYEDNNMCIIPFFQKFPIFVQQSRNSVINYLCIIKDKQNPEAVQKTVLIITYKSLQQIKQILQQKDAFKSLNQNMGLLKFIRQKSSNYHQKDKQQNNTTTWIKPNFGLKQQDLSTNNQIKSILQRYDISSKKNKYQTYNKKIRLESIIHIVENSQLLNSQQFYALFNKIDELCHVSSNTQNPVNNKNHNNNKQVSHLFYGYGIKSQKTTIHDLIQSYLKGVRFYSICAKLLKLIPNITLNHYSYWSPIYQKDFLNLQQKINNLKIINPKSSVELYRPFHQMSSQSGGQSHNKISYKIDEDFLKLLKYPLFSNAIEFRSTDQVKNNLQTNPYYNYYKTTLNKKKSRIKQQKSTSSYDPKVIFLGTNSKSSSSLRNVSGILIEFNQTNLCLLDCGPGTYEQFVHHYAPDQLNRKLLGLKIMFITHLHADHNLGILDLISKRNKLVAEADGSIENKMFLIIPFNMIGWIHYYCRYVQNIIQGCHIVFSQTLSDEKINIKDQYFQSKYGQIHQKRVKMTKGKLFQGSNQSCFQGQPNFLNEDFYNKYIQRDASYQQFVETLNHQDFKSMDIIFEKHKFKQPLIKHEFQTFLNQLGIKKFLPSKVFHCPQSYGVIIQHKNGTKISYSGDCRPTPEFIKQASGSKLLIHEATFETQHQNRAISRLHSTFHEALQAGLNSSSETVCLTHFTPGPYDRGAAQSFQHHLYKPQILQYYKKKAIVAVDHLQFKLSEVQQANYISKTILKLGTNSISQKNKIFQFNQDKNEEIIYDEEQQNEE